MLDLYISSHTRINMEPSTSLKSYTKAHFDMRCTRETINYILGRGENRVVFRLVGSRLTDRWERMRKLNSDSTHINIHVILLNPNPEKQNLDTNRVTYLIIRVCGSESGSWVMGKKSKYHIFIY